MKLTALALVLSASLGATQFVPSRSLILEPPDAEELVTVLAEATAAQGICYGWEVNVLDESGSTGTGQDVGSNRGVGMRASSLPCERWIIFRADLHYTSESSEASDSATFRVLSNIAGAPTDDDLRDAGISGARLLSGRDDLAVIDAVSALPLLATERGIAAPVPLEANTEPLPAGDRATGTPGSDWLRQNGALIGLAAVFLIFGVAWGLLAAFRPTWISDFKEATAHAD